MITGHARHTLHARRTHARTTHARKQKARMFNTLTITHGPQPYRYGVSCMWVGNM